MTQLEVGSKLQSLRHRDVTPGLEHHHGNGTTRKRVTDDELGNDVQADLLVGDSLDNANGDGVHECY